MLVMGGGRSDYRNRLGHGETYKNRLYRNFSDADAGRAKIIKIAEAEIGVQEHLENSSPRIDTYNAYVGFKKVAWCAAFVSWCHRQAGYPQPRTAWSPALFPQARITGNPVAGSVAGIYFSDLKRIGHCGIVCRVKNDLVYTIEGNTNLSGGREGDGVYRRIRHVRSIHRFADWITDKP